MLVHKSNNESDIKINDFCVDIHDDAVAEVVEIPEANELANDQCEMDAINIQSDQPHLTMSVLRLRHSVGQNMTLMTS